MNMHVFGACCVLYVRPHKGVESGGEIKGQVCAELYASCSQPCNSVCRH